MSNIIEKIDYFPAGYCTSYSGLLFKGLKNEKMIFPAGVFLIKHKEKGYILYDTGYHYDIEAKFRYCLYRLGTPVRMKKRYQISFLLQSKGINPEEIKYVILSHLHPDHLGGASFFPNARFILTEDVFEVYQKPKLKDLIFKEFLPLDFEDRLMIIDPEQRNSSFPYRPICDLFGDGSLLVSSVSGHAKGQACLFIPSYNLLIAADLCWGVNLLPYTKEMRFIPSLVQDNKRAYIKGTEFLEKVLKDGIDVIVSRDPVERVESILHEKNNLS
jgi:metal dependent hydrolase